MFIYLCPLVSALGPTGQTQQQPKYNPGPQWASMPYGLEPLAIVSTPKQSPNLNQSDVYAFPQDLTQIMSDEDVALLDTFGANNNVPTGSIIPGEPFVRAVVIWAQIHLLAQFIAGQTGQPLFVGTGTTLASPASSSYAISTAVSVTPTQSAQGVGNVGTGVGTGTGTGTGSGSPTPLFDFSNVDPNSLIGDVLADVAKQFNSPISLGGF